MATVVLRNTSLLTPYFFGTRGVRVLTTSREPQLVTGPSDQAHSSSLSQTASTPQPGTNAQTIWPSMNHLRSHGIGAILDYAAEDDTDGETGSAQQKEVVARTYSYEDERKCDAHVETFLHAIETAANLSGRGFAAIKVTALGNPKVLEKVSRNLRVLHDIFRQCDSDGDGYISRPEFVQLYQGLFPHATEERVDRAFRHLDVDGSGMVDYIRWCQRVPLRDMPSLVGLIKKHGNIEDVLGKRLTHEAVSSEELELLNNTLGRIRKLADAAVQGSTRLMVDAEHTYFQPAIDHIVTQLQREYNRDKPLIYGTYQCYLKDSYKRLLIDLDRAEREGYKFGAKLVRGAYMHLERNLAAKKGESSPIHDTLEDTHNNYDKCTEVVLKAVKAKGAEVMFATHNPHSIELVVEHMNSLGLPPGSSNVYFGQLLGMADHLTFTLGNNGYQAYKYVPYGPVPLVMPYLIRRALENSDIMGGGVVEQLRLLRMELWRRMVDESVLGSLLGKKKERREHPHVA